MSTNIPSIGSVCHKMALNISVTKCQKIFSLLYASKPACTALKMTLGYALGKKKKKYNWEVLEIEWKREKMVRIGKKYIRNMETKKGKKKKGKKAYWNKHCDLSSLFKSFSRKKVNDWDMTINTHFNGSQLAKLKKSIPLMLLPWNSKGRSTWSKKNPIILEKYNFGEYVIFGAISWKINNLPITV